MVNNLHPSAEGTRDAGVVPVWGTPFPGGGNGSALQYSYRGDPMDRGA